MQETTAKAAATAAEAKASLPTTNTTPNTTPTSSPATLTGGGLLALLPGGTDRLVASFLGAPQSLYCLACSHRNLGGFISFVERLDQLTPARLESLLDYFQCGALLHDDGNGESDADVDNDEEDDKKLAADDAATEENNGEAEQQGERLPLLRHLHFGAGYEWASSGSGGDESGNEQIQSRTSAAGWGDALKHRHLVPKLESLDLSKTFMSASDLDCIIEGLGQTRPLRTLLLPGFSQEAARSKSHSSVGERAILSKLPHLREVGNRHGTGTEHLIAMNRLSSKAQAPAQERNARLEAIDFARRYGRAQVLLKPSESASSLFPSRRLLPSLRVCGYGYSSPVLFLVVMNLPLSASSNFLSLSLTPFHPYLSGAALGWSFRAGEKLGFRNICHFWKQVYEGSGRKFSVGHAFCFGGAIADELCA